MLVMAVFAIGFLAGGLTMNLYFTTVKSADPAPATSSRESKKELLGRLTEELKLSPEQAQQIEGILTETREDYLRLRRETHPQYQQIRTRSRDRIRQALRPDQLPRFEEMVRQRDEERKRQFEKESQ